MKSVTIVALDKHGDYVAINTTEDQTVVTIHFHNRLLKNYLMDEFVGYEMGYTFTINAKKTGFICHGRHNKIWRIERNYNTIS